MNWFRTNRARRFATVLAILGLLIQAGLAIWHGTAMLAHSLDLAEPSAQAQMMCHATTAQDQTDQSGTYPDASGCLCCLGLVSVASGLAVGKDVAPDQRVMGQQVAAMASIRAVRNFLVPEIRGPPHTV